MATLSVGRWAVAPSSTFFTLGPLWDSMDIRILGVPMDLGANRRGTDMGPSAVRAANLAERLERLGHEVTDGGNVFSHEPETRGSQADGVRFLDEIVDTCEELSRRVQAAKAAGEIPLVVGGDHSLAMGTAGGIATNETRVGILWIDAHTDFNTPDTSPSGNVHGMPLSAIAGHGNRRLCEIGGVAPKAREEDIVIIGARSVDGRERELLQKSGVTVFTMRDIDERGMGAVMEAAVRIATRDTDWLHVSFDLDAVDPEIAPGVGTPKPGGLTYREAHLALELVNDTGAMRSMELVEVNPILDEQNRTAELAVELAASAFGKQIL